MKIVADVYIFAHLKYPHKAVLKDLTPYTFQRFVDFVLGEHVLGLEAKDEAGWWSPSPLSNRCCAMSTR